MAKLKQRFKSVWCGFPDRSGGGQRQERSLGSAALAGGRMGKHAQCQVEKQGELRGEIGAGRVNPCEPAKSPPRAAGARGARGRLGRFAGSILSSAARTMPSPDDL